MFGAGLSGLKLNASYNAYFDAQDPILQEHRNLQSTFSISDSLIIALEFAEPIALEPAAVELLHTLKRDLLSLDIVVEISSVLDLESSEQAGFDELDLELFNLDSETALSAPIPTIDIRAVSSDPRAYGLLVSNDKTALVLDITTNLPQQTSAPQLLQALSDIRTVVQKTARLSNLKPTVRFSGPLALNEAYISVIRHDLKVFLPTLILSMGIVLTLLFGSFSLTCIALGIALLSIVSSFGLAGWLNYELAAINAFAPVIIASIALAGSVHIFNSYYQFLVEGKEPEKAIVLAVSENAFPLMLTSLTTAGGFLALSYSPSPPIRTIGFVVAMGVLFSWLFIMLVLPALLKIANAQPIRARWLVSFIEVICNTITRFPKQILIFSVVVGATAIPLVAQNKINDNVFEYFPNSHQFKRDLQVINEKFSGINPQIFSVSAPQTYGALDVDFLNELNTFQHWLSEQTEVRKTLSITGFSAVREQLASSSDGRFTRYQEMAKLHTPHGLGIENLVDSDYRTVALHVYVDSLDAKSLIEFNARVTVRLKNHFPEFVVASGGTSLVFAHLGHRNAASMLYALVAAVLVISLICIFILTSFHGAWIGALCNLLPVFIVYAWWALVDGNISIGGAVVIGMILGIVVDDTLYMLTKFSKARKRGELFPEISMLTRVGPALIITSVTIIVGLSAGLLSDFRPIRAMSGLSIGVIFIAVIIDLFCLTAILAWLGKRQPRTAGLD